MTVDRLGTCADGTRLATCDGGTRLAGCQTSAPPPFGYPCGFPTRNVMAARAFCRFDNDEPSFSVLGITLTTGGFFRARRIVEGVVVGESVEGMIATNAAPGGLGTVDIAAARDALVQLFNLQDWPTPDVSLPGPPLPGATPSIRTQRFSALRGVQPYLRYTINTANPANPTAPDVDLVCLNACSASVEVFCGLDNGVPLHTRPTSNPNPYPDALPTTPNGRGIAVIRDGVELESREVWAHRGGVYLPDDFVSPCPDFQPGTASPPPGMPDPGEFLGMGAAANRGGCCG